MSERASVEAFQARLAQKLCQSGREWQDRHNVDTDRFPALGGSIASLKSAVLSTLAHAGFIRRAQAQSWLSKCAEIFGRTDGLARLYELLCDEESREILIEVLAYRILGHRHVKLSRNSSDYQSIMPALRRRKLVMGGSEYINPITKAPLELVDLKGIGRDIRFFGSIPSVRDQFVVDQYRLMRASRPVRVEPGDVVVDGGACWGETSLRFADDAGAAGRVVSFEFMPENLRVFRASIALNPALAQRIDLVEQPLWDCRDETLEFIFNGPGSHRAKAGHSGEALEFRTTTIDAVLESRGLPRLDFIKLDVEGAELHALKGAETAVRRYRPKMAVCLYHSLDDFADIPAWINSLGLGYRLYLDHFSIHAEETVLFAVPE